MLIQNYKCDVCGMLKGEGNRWLIGTPTAIPDADYWPGYFLGDWTDRAASLPNAHHLCGENCAAIKQSEYIRRDR